MNDETKIEPCPMPGCGGECYTSRIVGGWAVFCPCGYRVGRQDTESAAIAAHNAHCAFIDKGREHTQLIATNEVFAQALTERDEAVDHLDTAVMLLKPFATSRDAGGNVPACHIDVHDFLALDAIKAILKQKAADAAALTEDKE